MKPIALVLSVLVFAQLALAATDLSVLISMSMRPDGSAHVKERYNILLNSDGEVESFENYRIYGQNTVVEWRRFVSSLQFHVSNRTTPSNVKLTARRLLNIGSRSALVELEYDLPGQVAEPAQISSRIVRYTLNTSLLTLDSTFSRELLLPQIFTLTITAPPGSTIVRSSILPEPSVADSGSVSWNGPMAGRFTMAYDTEQPLGDEVREYFDSLYSQGASFVPLAIPIAALLLVGAFLASKLVKEK